jgi:hypothetical protein
MSIERAADLMGVLLDAPVSTGFAGGLIARMAERLVGFEQALKDRLRAAPVMHHDETPARVAVDDHDRLLYIYTARAGKLTWFGAADNRGHAALDGFAILPGYTPAPWCVTTTPPTPSTTSTSPECSCAAPTCCVPYAASASSTPTGTRPSGAGANPPPKPC